LTAAGRQAGGWDESTTELSVLRDVCDHYGQKCYDPNNFMNSVSDLADSLRRVGEQKDLRIRVTPTGFDQGKLLAARLAGVRETTIGR
jgi:hypothetical protein